MLINGFEGGLDGSAVTPANSGGQSGSAFDNVIFGGSGQVLYSAASAIHGSVGVLTTLSGNAESAVQWSASFGSPTRFWVRDYFTIGSLPSAVTRVFQAEAASPLWGVAVDSSGHLGVYNISGASFPSGGLSGTALTPGTVVRYELSAVFSAGSWTVVLKGYLGQNSNAEGITPDFTLSPSAMTLGSASACSFGAIAASASSWSVTHDDIAVSVDGPIGVYVSCIPGMLTSRTIGRPAPLFRVRRGRQFLPAIPQSVTGFSFPLYKRQPGALPKLLPYIRRSRNFAPVPAQASTGINFPLILARPPLRRFLPVPRLTRGRFIVPPMGQANRGVSSPIFVRSRAHALRRFGPRIARGRYFDKRLVQFPQGAPFNLVTRRAGRSPRWMPPVSLGRMRRIEPPWPQAARGIPFPLWTRRPTAVHGRLAFIRRSPRIRQWIVSKVTQHAAASLSAAGTMSASAVLTRKAAAAFSAAGTLRASPVITRKAAAAFGATGTLRATASVTRVASAALHGTGTMTAPDVVTKHAAAALSAAGTLAATATGTPGVALRASGTMSVTAKAIQLASAALVGEGTMLASAGVEPPVQEILIEPNRIAPWDQVVSGGTWQRQEPPDSPATITAEATILGTYDQE